MTILDVPRTGTLPVLDGRGRLVDVRRLGLLALDHAPVRVGLAFAARLAEADHLLPAGTRLLVLAGHDDRGAPTRQRPGGPSRLHADDCGAATHGSGDAVDVTLADRRGFPLWMGSLPTGVDLGGVRTVLPADRGLVVADRQRSYRTALRALGLVQRGGAWSHWEFVA